MVILAQQNPVFQRAMRIIESITQANPAVVTTTFAHNYLTDDIVRINIPLGQGMTQINQMKSVITVLSSTTFALNVIDSTSFDPFNYSSSGPQYAQVVPVGELSSTLDSATQNVLPYSAS